MLDREILLLPVIVPFALVLSPSVSHNGPPSPLVCFPRGSLSTNLVGSHLLLFPGLRLFLSTPEVPYRITILFFSHPLVLSFPI